jgi:hypothetical protein
MKSKSASGDSSIADLWRQAQAKQDEEAAARPRGLTLPDVSLRQIAKVGGGIGIASVLIWGTMTLFAGGPPTGRPSGRVLLDGKPVVGCDMRFVPADDPDQAFIGISGGGGDYQVSYRTFNGLPVGRYQVTITRYETADGKELDYGEESEAQTSDAKAVSYSFETDIARGSNAVDFELKQGQKAPSGQ